MSVLTTSTVASCIAGIAGFINHIGIFMNLKHRHIIDVHVTAGHKDPAVDSGSSLMAVQLNDFLF